MVVLLKNTTRELRCYNVGDKGVKVERQIPAQTKSGSMGFKTMTRHVSSSVTLTPGQWTRVPGIILKQRAVQRDLDKGVLQKVVQSNGASDTPPAPARKVEVAASAPLASDKGSHPVEEEGSVGIAEFKQAQATEKAKAKATRKRGAK
jgi:hypothetical protein